MPIIYTTKPHFVFGVPNPQCNKIGRKSAIGKSHNTCYPNCIKSTLLKKFFRNERVPKRPSYVFLAQFSLHIWGTLWYLFLGTIIFCIKLRSYAIHYCITTFTFKSYNMLTKKRILN